MATTDQGIYDALTGLEVPAPAKKSPCGCGGTSSVSSGEGGGLAAELEAALQSLGGEAGGDDLLGFDESTLEDDLLFSDAGQDPAITLQDLVSLAEQYPGLKITISF